MPAPGDGLCTALTIVTACALAQAPGASASTLHRRRDGRRRAGQPRRSTSVLCLINERRAAAGVGARPDERPAAPAAARHSNEMVQNGFFGHTSPAGSTFIDRIRPAGYTAGRAARGCVGENLVWGSGGLSTPASMVEAWMDSPPHRANLLRGRFREIGLSGARGTPDDAGDPNGITVSTEYGYRAPKAHPEAGAGRRRPASRSVRHLNPALAGARYRGGSGSGKPFSSTSPIGSKSQVLGVRDRLDHRARSPAPRRRAPG